MPNFFPRHTLELQTQLLGVVEADLRLVPHGAADRVAGEALDLLHVDEMVLTPRDIENQKILFQGLGYTEGAYEDDVPKKK